MVAPKPTRVPTPAARRWTVARRMRAAHRRRRRAASAARRAPAERERLDGSLPDPRPLRAVPSGGGGLDRAPRRRRTRHLDGQPLAHLDDELRGARPGLPRGLRARARGEPERHRRHRGDLHALPRGRRLGRDGPHGGAHHLRGPHDGDRPGRDDQPRGGDLHGLPIRSATRASAPTRASPAASASGRADRSSARTRRHSRCRW